MLTPKFTQKQQIALLEDIAAFVSAGISPYEAVSSILAVAKKRKRARMVKCLTIIIKRMDAGKPLAQSMHGLMDGAALSMLATGEQSGDLAGSAKEAAEMLSVREEMIGVLLKSLAMPATLFIMLTLLIYYISMQVIPAAQRLLPEEHMSSLSKSYFAFGNWFIEWGLLSAATLMLCVFIIVLTFGTWSGPTRSKVDSVFPWSLYRYIQSGAVLMMLSGMMRSGIPFGQTLESISKFSSSWTRKRLSLCRSFLAKGRTEAESLSLSGLLPPEIDDRLSVYSRLPNFEAIMVPLARDAFDRAKIRLRQFSALFTTAIMLLVALFILFTIFGLGDAAMSASDAASKGTRGL